MLPFVLLSCIGGLLLLSLNAYRWGSPFNLGYRGEVFHPERILNGLWGLLVGANRGLIWYCPIALIGLSGFPAFFRSRKRAAVTLAGVGVLAAILYSMWTQWDGGAGWGPRYLVPFLFTLLIPAAFWKGWKGVW